MKKVERTFHGTTRSYPIYTKTEADGRGIDYVYWKEVTDEGAWVISDDEWVCQVIRVNGPYKNSAGVESRQVVLPYCRRFTTGASRIVFEDYYGKGDYSSPTPDGWIDRELRSKRARRVIRFYSVLLMKKGRVPEKDLEVLGRIYRPDQKEPAATLKRLLRQKKTKKMVQEELIKLLSENDITPQYVIEGYKEVLEEAKKHGQLSVAKKTLDTFAEMVNLAPDKRYLQGALPKGGVDDDELVGFLESEKTEVVDEDPDSDFIDAEEADDEQL